MSDNKLEITIGAKLAKGFGAAFGDAKKSVSGLRTEIIDLRKQQGLIKKFQMDMEAAKTAKTRLSEVRQQIKALDFQIKKDRKLGISTKAAEKNIAALGKRAGRLESAVAKANTRLIASKSAMNSAGIGAAQAKAKYSALDSQIKKLGNSYARLGEKAQKAANIQSKISSLKSSAVGAGASGAGFAGLLAPFAGFEKAMSVLQAKSAEMTDKQAAMLKDVARNLGRQMQFTATQAAEGMTFLSMAGFSADDIKAASKSMLELAASAGIAIKDSADISSNILSGFGLKASEMGRVSDVLATTFTSSNVSLVQLGETMKYVGPIASKAGVGLEQAAAMAGMLGDVGIQGSMAGTALRAALIRLAAPPKKAAKQLDALGISISDANGNMRDMPIILSEINSKMQGFGNAEKLKAISEIFGTEAASAMMELVSKSDVLMQKYNGIMENSAGKTAQIAAKMNDNLMGALGRAASSVADVAITFGAKLGPALTATVDSFTSVVNSIGGFLSAHPKVTQGIAAIAAGFAALSVGGLVLRFGSLITAVSGIGSALPLVAMGFRAIGAAMVANPIGAIVTVIAGAATLIYANWEKIAPFFQSVWSGIKTGATAIWDGITSAASSAWSGIQSAWSGTVGFFARIWNGVKSGASGAWSAIKAAAAGDLAPIKGIASGVFNAVKTIISASLSAAKTATILAAKGIASSAIAGWGVLKSGTVSVFNIIKSGISKSWSVIKSGTISAFNSIKSTATDFGKALKTINQAALNIVAALWDSAWANIKSAFNSAKAGIVGAVQGLADDILNVFKDLPSKFKEFGSNIIEGVKKGIDSKIDAVGKSVSGMADSIKNKFKSMLGIKSPSRVFMGYGGDIMVGLGVGIEKNKGDVIGKFSGMFDSVGGTFSKMSHKIIRSIDIDSVGDAISKNLNGARNVLQDFVKSGLKGFADLGGQVNKFSKQLTNMLIGASKFDLSSLGKGLGNLISPFKGGGISAMFGNASNAFSLAGALGGSKNSQIGASIGSIAGSFIPIIGSALGSFLGGALGSLFTKKPKLRFDQAITGNETSYGGRNDIIRESEFGKFGLSGHSRKLGRAGKEYDKALQDMLNITKASDHIVASLMSPKQIEAAKKALATSKTGKFTDGIGWGNNGADMEAFMMRRLAAQLSVLDPEMKNLITSAGGLKEQIKRVAVVSEVSSVALPALNSLGFKLGDSVVTAVKWGDALKFSGETASQALMRSAANFKVVSQSAALLNLNFSGTGLGILKASNSLIEFMGGLEAFSSATSKYYSNFYSEQERGNIALASASLTIKQFNESLGRTGSAAITSKEGFRKYIEGLDLTTKSGQKAFANAMKIQDSFVAVAKSGMTLDEALKSLPESALATAKAVLDASNTQKSAADGQAEASNKVATAANNAKSSLGGLKSALGSISSAASSAASKVREAANSISSSAGSAKSATTDGSHASGLMSVPFDGYIAETHKDETILPARLARVLRAGGTISGGTGNNISDIKSSKKSQASKRAARILAASAVFSPALAAAGAGGNAPSAQSQQIVQQEIHITIQAEQGVNKQDIADQIVDALEKAKRDAERQQRGRLNGGGGLF